jgi:hypothetical protein
MRTYKLPILSEGGETNGLYDLYEGDTNNPLRSRLCALLILSVEGGTNGVYDLPDWHTDNLLRSRLCAFISCLYRPKRGATGLHNVAPPFAHTA